MPAQGFGGGERAQARGAAPRTSCGRVVGAREAALSSSVARSSGRAPRRRSSCRLSACARTSSCPCLSCVSLLHLHRFVARLLLCCVESAIADCDVHMRLPCNRNQRCQRFWAKFDALDTVHEISGRLASMIAKFGPSRDVIVRVAKVLVGESVPLHVVRPRPSSLLIPISRAFRLGHPPLSFLSS